MSDAALARTAWPKKRIAAFVLGMLLSMVLLYLSFRGVSLRAFLSELGSVSLPILLLCEVTKFAAFVCTATRAKLLLAPLFRYPFWRVLRAQLLLFLANNTLPFRLGELVRVHYLAIHGGIPHASCLAVAATERLIDLGVLLLLLLGMVAFVDCLPVVGSVYALGAGVLLALLAALWISRCPQRFVQIAARLTRPLGQAVSGFMRAKAEVFARGFSALASLQATLWVILASLGFWLMQTAGVRIWLWAWGLSLPWYAPLTVILFLVLGTAIPSAPGYLGTYHYFAIAALQRFGVARTTAVSFAVVAHVMAIGPFTLIAFVVAWVDYARGELFSWRAIRELATRPGEVGRGSL